MLRTLLTLGLVTLVVLGAATTTPWRTAIPWHLLDRDADFSLPQISPAPSRSPEAPLQPGEADTGVTLTIALLFAGLVFALLLALAARGVLAALRTPPTPSDSISIRAGTSIDAPAPSPISTDELQDAVARALAHLADAATPHDAVVAAWVALEDAATRHGTPRDLAQTPTEFTFDVLHTTPAPATHLDNLRGLYHHARFTTHPVTDQDVTAARTALEHIARALDTNGDRRP